MQGHTKKQVPTKKSLTLATEKDPNREKKKKKQWK